MKLEELAVVHPYYCSDSNYYSNDAGCSFETATDFLEEFNDADIDMNLVFRWDVKPHLDAETEEVTDKFYADVFMIHQRKGIFAPYHIESITEDEASSFAEYLRRHKEALTKLWEPL
ncbi:hypothetical protein VPFG_00239 [Vibrio phage nt-1]|uniref:Uncharacterized protein n=1 Tax=Vibrio phage nt-1 TaxID=115992 RepID=R9TGL1_9CAUD|nr:hypothetical protein VPFG_00239 [Vibrio phage nt-1]AGN30238.1 hypothetical protein VPFG_00239 [Vibrio phage nt-1]